MGERATEIVPAGRWPREQARDRLRLVYDDRFKRRFRYRAAGGLDVLLDLPEARLLNDGDGLLLESGGFVAIEALPEPLLHVAVADAETLTRIAWHLGNRHLPVQTGTGWLRLRADHVIEDLLHRLGATVTHLDAPFTPEGGGYGSAPVGGVTSHAHDHPPRVASPSLMQGREDAGHGAALYRLMTWLSSAYPVGGFSYSHGIEYAVEAGLVRDRAALVAWIAAILREGSGRIDGALFAAVWRAAKAGDDRALDDVAELAAAWRGTAELSLESSAQGAAFVAVTTRAWPDETLAALAARHGGRLAFPVAVAVAMAPHVPLAEALAGYLTAFAANLVGAGVRLIPLGQTDGQLAVAALESCVADAARAAMDADLDEIGTATPMLDWSSMRHETQYTRLFRS